MYIYLPSYLCLRWWNAYGYQNISRHNFGLTTVAIYQSCKILIISRHWALNQTSQFVPITYVCVSNGSITILNEITVTHATKWHFSVPEKEGLSDMLLLEMWHGTKGQRRHSVGFALDVPHRCKCAGNISSRGECFTFAYKWKNNHVTNIRTRACIHILKSYTS